MPRNPYSPIAPSCRPGWQARAFKLIHVLAIVGVIGLALGIAIPAIAHSRERARAVVCRGNLEHIGTALRLYATDFANTLPYEDRGEEISAGRKCWFDAIDPYLAKAGAGPNDKTCPTAGLGGSQGAESYKMNSKLAPSPPKPGASGKNPAPTGNAEPPKPYRKLNTLPRPQATVVLFDGDVGGKKLSFKGRWRDQDDDVNYRHNNATNILFADWHVEDITKDTLKKRSIHNTPVVWQPADAGVWDPMEQKAKKTK